MSNERKHLDLILSQIITMRNFCNNTHLPILILRPCESFYLLCYEVSYSENICKITGNGGNFFWNVILLVIPLPFHFNTFHSSRCIAIKAVPRLALHFISCVWWIRHIQHIQRAIYFIMKDIYSYLPLLRIYDVPRHSNYNELSSIDSCFSDDRPRVFSRW